MAKEQKARERLLNNPPNSGWLLLPSSLPFCGFKGKKQQQQQQQQQQQGAAFGGPANTANVTVPAPSGGDLAMGEARLLAEERREARATVRHRFESVYTASELPEYYHGHKGHARAANGEELDLEEA